MAAQVPSRLYRSRSQKILAGVCGGLGEYFDVDPVLIRLLFVVTAFISGVGILAYIVLWILVPLEGDDGSRMDALKRDFDDISGRVREYIDPSRTGGTSSAATPAAGEASPAAGPDVNPHANPRFAPDTDADEDAPMTADPDTSPPTAHRDPSTAGAPPTGTDPLTHTSAPPGPPTGGPTDDPTGGPTAAPSGGASAAPYSAPYGEPVSAPYGEPHGPAATADLVDEETRRAVAAYRRQSDAASPTTTERRRRRQHWAGAILILVGLLILGNNFGLLRWARPEYVLPLILVAIGAWLLFGRGRNG
jgi:phage shock protein C